MPLFAATQSLDSVPLLAPVGEIDLLALSPIFTAKSTDGCCATVPCQHDRELNLREITTPIAERPVGIYRRDEQVGLLANLVMRRYRRDMSAYSPSEQDG